MSFKDNCIRNYIPKKSDFWFLPLGGSNEIGMNLNLFGHDGCWIIVDCGVSFNDKYGTEIIAPDISFIKEKKILIEAIVVTHAHEDHIGAIPYLWPELKCPIYATPFTASIIRQKLFEKKWKDSVKIHDIDLSGNFDIGPFSFEYVSITHSVPEPNAIVISTPLGRVVHTGDWKIDPQPLLGPETDMKRLREVGDEGVLSLICDSTSVFVEGSSGSEADVKAELTKMIESYPDKRITVTCFASNLARIETIALAAKSVGRHVVLLGRSLLRMTEAARKNGYLSEVPEFLEEIRANNYPNEKVLFICTGSQGEQRAALARIASHSHPRVRMNENDVVIFSSRMIPGNEKNISIMQNQLVRSNVTVVTATDNNIHVSGHPSRDDLKMMYEMTKPDSVIPVHGEAKHLFEQARLAKEMGIKASCVPNNGTLIELSKTPKILETVHSGRVYYDGERLLSAESTVFKDRARMATEGSIFITIQMNKNDEIIARPYISICGLLEKHENTEKIQKNLIRILNQVLKENIKKDELKRHAMGQAIRRFFIQNYKKKPMTYIHLLKNNR